MLLTAYAYAYTNNALHNNALRMPTMIFEAIRNFVGHHNCCAYTTMVQLKDEFESIAAARTAITNFVLNQGESYKTVASDKKRYIICCKDSECKFRIRATRSAKEVVSITICEPHTCTPATHYKSRQHQSVCSICLYVFRVLITI
jgi:hypothetical protein